MKCDTDSIISILYKVESEETIKPIFFHNGTVTPDVCKSHIHIKVALEDPSYLVEESNMANNEYNFNAPVGSVGNQGTQTNVTGVVEGDQIGTQYNSPQEKTLAEAAAEIQKLLKQIEQTNPTATVEQQQAYVNAAISPNLKERFVSALRAGGETAIDEFFNNPYVKVGKAIVMAWIQS